MAIFNLIELSPIELLRLYSDVLNELRQRKVTTTMNAPLGDYAEWLFRRAFGWEAAGNSAKDVDAIGLDGKRYQIKGRRLATRNKSRQLGAIRRLQDGNFDNLAAVLFNEDFSVMRAALVPIEIVQNSASRVEATNSWRFMLRDQVWDQQGVVDVTEKLSAASR